MTTLPDETLNTILKLAQNHGLSHHEIAERVGKTPHSVMCLLKYRGLDTARRNSVVVLNDPRGDYGIGARFSVKDLHLGMVEVDGELAWYNGMRFEVNPLKGNAYTAIVIGRTLIREDTGQRLHATLYRGGRWVAQ